MRHSRFQHTGTARDGIAMLIWLGCCVGGALAFLQSAVCFVLCLFVCLYWTWTLFNGTMPKCCIKFVFSSAFSGLSDSVGDPYVDEGLKLNFGETKFVSKFRSTEVMQQHWVVTSGKIRNKCQRNLDPKSQVISNIKSMT